MESCQEPIRIKARIAENQAIGSLVITDPSMQIQGDLIHPLFELNQGLLKTKQVLDYEKTSLYHLKIDNGVHKTTLVEVQVENLNDNLPVFNETSTTLVWKIKPENALKYSKLGQLSAYDPDGEPVIYGLDHPDPCCIVVPQTGAVLLVNSEHLPAQLTVLAKEKSQPHRQSRITLVIDLLDNSEDEIEDNDLEPHSRQKRRATRAVRPTKRTEFTEADGQMEGKIVFQLEKESQHETFKIRDENPWVTVEPNGAVRVKKRWDYEELGREKTIDFWVIITNTGAAGKKKSFNLPNFLPSIFDLISEWRGLQYTDNQRVIIKIKDVNDEPPYFINRPLPMQAVVKLNAPPNTRVFTLQAKDPDTDHNIHYFLVRDRTGGRFEVDERSGVVRTRGTEPFQLDMEYVLYVKAEDQNGRDGNGWQGTKEERLSIVGGKRPPQFYMPSYEAEIPESQKKDSDIISVKAKSFADREIRYTLKAQNQGQGTFNIGPSTGIVKLAKELDFEDLRQPHIYQLLVTATEDSGGFSTSVELIIKVSDVNDNAPKFELPDYQAHNVEEDIPIGTSILKVKAADADSGSNADIEYYVSDDHFTVNSKGIVSNAKRLDADSNNAYYEFVVTAKDRGEPPRTGTATVRIYTENKNDEEPKFSQQVYTPNVDENAGPNTLVTTVVASDKDGDGVTFGFVGGSTTSGLFRIEENTGVIRLVPGLINLDRDKYELNVTATDDGKCCLEPGKNLYSLL